MLTTAHFNTELRDTGALGFELIRGNLQTDVMDVPLDLIGSGRVGFRRARSQYDLLGDAVAFLTDS